MRLTPAGRRAPARARVVSALLVALVLPSCAAGASTPSDAGSPPAPATTSAGPESPTPVPSGTGGTGVPAGWTPHTVDGISFALPPGVVEVDRASDDDEVVVAYDNVATAGGDAFVRLSVDRGPFVPFDFHVEVQTDNSSAQVGHEPTWGPRPVAVPGTDRAAATSWSWTGGEPSAPRRTVFALVEAGPELHYFFQVGGSQGYWPEKTVDALLASMAVAEEA